MVHNELSKKAVTAFACFFVIAEAFKQVFLYNFIFNGEYRIWYFPFQLCSIPIYLSIYLAIRTFKFSGDQHDFVIHKSDSKIGKLESAVRIFACDFFLLGGIAAVIYHEGFTFPDYPVMTLHGYVWHIMMIIFSVYLFAKSKDLFTWKNFLYALLVFLFLLLIALALNIALSGYGDCDMFYISPYHISSQPVFDEIDIALGRPLGIAIYSASVALGAAIVHCIYKIFAHIKSHLV